MEALFNGFDLKLMVLTPKNENKIMSLLVGNNQDIPANQTSQSGPFAVKLGYLPNSCDIQNLKILRQLNCLNGFKPLDDYRRRSRPIDV